METTKGNPLKQAQRDILDNLARLGGSQFDDDTIAQEGDKLVLPENMTLQQAVKFLQGRIAADEEFVDVKRRFNYRPWDGAIASYRVLKRTFGAVLHEGQTIETMFGSHEEPPQFITVNVGPDETIQVPWGKLAIPLLPDTQFILGAVPSDLGLLFAVSVNTPRKFKAHVDGVLNLIEQELKVASIYRGKAFDGKEMPDFLDLTGVSRDKVVYSNDTLTQLEANIWSVMRHTDALREAGISRKRSALLYGPYGTGKTLTGHLTAQVAVQNGWTCIVARPGRDDLEDVMRTAQLYQPACVFAEDLDAVADSSQVSADMAARLLDIFDGITAKNTELLVVLTTNHPERIHKGMLRPGRLDAVIEVAGLDAAGIQKLVSVSVPASSLGNIDWPLVCAAMEGMLPSYVKEGADRAFRYALARAGGDAKGIRLTTEDLVNAAIGLRPQLDLMEGAKERAERDPLGVQFGRLVERTIVDTISPDFIPSDVYERVTNDGQVT